MPAPALNIDLRHVGALESSGQLSGSSLRRHDEERARDSPAMCEGENGRAAQ